MKIAFFVAALISFNLLANEVPASNIITGEAAEKIYQELKGYEYSAGAITAGIEYHLTVRHNESMECQKEETRYTSSELVEILYSCIPKN
jgi:hypothetical protein